MTEIFSSETAFVLRPMGIRFFVPNDLNSAMALDLIWESQIHRTLTGFRLSLKGEEMIGEVKSD